MDEDLEDVEEDERRPVKVSQNAMVIWSGLKGCGWRGEVVGG